MNELLAQFTEWGRALRERRDELVARLPAWWPRAAVVGLIVLGALLPFAFAQTSGFLSATIIALGYVVMALGLNVVVGLAWFIGRTRLGKAMRATAQDPEAARLMGIDVNATISLTFLLGGMLAGAAGLIFALYETTVWYFQGFEAGLIAFTAAVMGGIGNVRGAVLGGLIIGCIQQISDARIGQEWTAAVVFGYLVLIMTLRPRGLLGEETREAG